ncbi:nuclear transport factor 2 family protein [Tenacibaculum larymnensis]|uniref:Nuclear transport factor 2 family protein n=1 Tax=Tenacibaculum larymnensis TaxID=2878201 RepID=A0A9X4ERL6_9FLAO|nr:nuclear transport factor 2 family protein [Tenacibaculum larymnensis]MDE1208173.1 nuclear transport factor 2 family protein [Tenacibaculum larymnensis]
MKIISTLISAFFFISSFSQDKEDIKEKLLVNIYGSKQQKVINYDKSFVSDDKLLYESIDRPEVNLTLSDKELIEQTLNNYIEGSSYNKLNILKESFSKDATLYLTGKNGFKQYSPDEYTNFFSPDKKGKFNGRIGEIISIDITKDIATAKVEILIPNRKWRFIDLFLLKKFTNQWKIISKTATRESSNETGNKILFVVSNTDYYLGTAIPTGNSFDEIILAYEMFKDAGFNIDVISPKGGAIPLKYLNTSENKKKEYLYDSDFMYALKNTKKPTHVHSTDYKAIYYVGGGSAMFNVPKNKEIQKIAIDIYEKQKGVISAVCHGTAGIVYLKKSNGEYLVKNKRVNGFPEDYEKKDRAYFKSFPFLIRNTIEKHGGKFFYSSSPLEAHVEVDGRLVTGQNPASVPKLVNEVIKIVNSK